LLFLDNEIIFHWTIKDSVSVFFLLAQRIKIVYLFRQIQQVKNYVIGQEQQHGKNKKPPTK